VSRNRRVQVEFTLPQLLTLNASLALYEAAAADGEDDNYRQDVMDRTRQKVWDGIDVAKGTKR
jgi:hypothetical protein